jgi:predicted DNA-binding protein (UPF0251 family)/phage FluMu protein Com
LEVCDLSLDEFEAIRLADFEGQYHEVASESMGVSRQTFGRIIESARHKVADALLNGKALSIKGGDVLMNTMRTFACASCGHMWQEAFGTGRPLECPSCKGKEFSRAEEERGRGRHGRGRGGCRRGTGSTNESR